MANEFQHKTVGTELTQAEFESITGHQFDSQATGDMPYASSASQLSRLAIGTNLFDVLGVASGLPAWGVMPFEALRAAFRKVVLVPVRVWSEAAQVVSGSGTTATALERVACNTGTTHASTAGRHYAIIANTNSASNQGLDFTKKIGISFTAERLNSDADLVARMVVEEGTAIGALSAHGFGVRWDNLAVQLVSRGTGGSEAAVDASTSMTGGAFKHFFLEFDPASALRLYINGALVATQDTAASLPSTHATANRLYPQVTRSGGAGVGDCRLQVANVAIIQANS